MKSTRLSISLLLVCSAIPASPQAPSALEAGAVRNHSANTQEFRELEKKLSDAAPESRSEDAVRATPSPPAPAPSSTVRFTVRRIEIGKSEILTEEELRNVTAKYEHPNASLLELNLAVEELNSLYKKKGYATARALLPPQSITDGVVHIALVEGRVGKISVATRTHTRDSYLLTGVHAKSGDLVHLDKLRRDLALINLNNDVKVRAVIQPGSEFGTTDIMLNVEEPESLRSAFMFDNAGHDAVGQQRVVVMEQYASVFGFRDPLAVGGSWALGMLEGFASYTLPLNPRGRKLGFTFDYNHIRLREGALARFGIGGDSWDASVKVSQPLLTRSRVLLSASLAPHLKHSNMAAAGFPLTQTQVRSAEMGFDLQEIDKYGVLSTNTVFSGGLHDLGGTNPFLKCVSTLARMQHIRGDVSAIVRITGQVNALSSLPPVEEIQVGGGATVRGYPEGRQIGDRGYSASAELQFPVPFAGHSVRGLPLGRRLKAAAFVDHGAVFDSYDRKRLADDRYLTSVGVGLTVRLSQYLNARVDVGVPLRNTAGISDVGVHYYLQVKPPIAALWNKLHAAAK